MWYTEDNVYKDIDLKYYLFINLNIIYNIYKDKYFNENQTPI